MANLLEILSDRRLEIRADEQLGESHHALQRIVDLVRDAGDELADRRQPLTVNQLLAQPPLLGDVALDRHHVGDVALAVDDARQRGRHCVGRAVRAQAVECPAPGAVRANMGQQVLGRNRLEHHQVAELHPFDVLFLAADGKAERAVCVAAPAVGRHDEDQILRLLNHIHQQLRRRPCLLELGAFGGDARNEQRQHGDQRHRGGQIAES